MLGNLVNGTNSSSYLTPKPKTYSNVPFTAGAVQLVEVVAHLLSGLGPAHPANELHENELENIVHAVEFVVHGPAWTSCMDFTKIHGRAWTCKDLCTDFANFATYA